MATGSIDGVTYFGLWSADQRARVVCPYTHGVDELFVQTADLDKLGTKLVELFPERKFAP